MPSYNTRNPPPFLGYTFPDNNYLGFNAEALAAGEFSQQVQIPIGPVAGQKGIRVEVDFNQNPGAFELDVMESDSDLNGSLNYQQVPSGGQINTVTNGMNGANTHQSTDLIPVAGQFVCIFVKTPPANAGTTATVRITRAA
jgi:hypothetical protein